MRNVYSGLTDAMVKSSWTKLEITKSKQPGGPLRRAAFYQPLPTALLDPQWGIF